MADDDTDDTDHGYSAPAADPVLIAIELCRIAKNKTLETAIRKLAKLNRQYADTQAKVAALAAQAEQINAALAQREAAIVAREAALDARVTTFESSCTDVRDELREHHARLEQSHRQLIHRIMSTAGILGEWNWNLQSPPTWEQLRRMVADLPADLPVTPPAEVMQENVSQDWTGHSFVPGSTLTRSISQ
jgi:hypothetical protein